MPIVPSERSQCLTHVNAESSSADIQTFNCLWRIHCDVHQVSSAYFYLVSTTLIWGNDVQWLNHFFFDVLSSPILPSCIELQSYPCRYIPNTSFGRPDDC